MNEWLSGHAVSYICVGARMGAAQCMQSVVHMDEPIEGDMHMHCRNFDVVAHARAAMHAASQRHRGMAMRLLKPQPGGGPQVGVGNFALGGKVTTHSHMNETLCSSVMMSAILYA